ncbi:hypothetical protein AGMMS49545_20920 [Betaproteobacteria bacterium]|nr:hypothetical protein AGMMS49545_20920 [Betaproteobacteria bacterium]
MFTIQKNRLLIICAAAFLFLAGCQEEETPNNQAPETLTDLQKLDKYKLGDWVHDIDAAEAILESARRGDLGPPTQELIFKLDAPGTATNLPGGDAHDCWPRWKAGVPGTADQIDTAHTDHACLDALGYKRSF